MFTPSDRRALRDALLERARRDEQISGAALVGSSGSDREDDWSDIDLALKLAPDTEPETAARTWSAGMYTHHAAVHHLDLWSGATLFRVFLLANSLQVDLSFWPAEDFRATTPAFRLIFGGAGSPETPATPSHDHLAGMGWLYALHVRSALARGRRWQAVYMLDGMRDQIIALACARHGLPGHQGRGVDQLPTIFTDALIDTRARNLDHDELQRAFTTTMQSLLHEVALDAPNLAARLNGPAQALTRGEAAP